MHDIALFLSDLSSEIKYFKIFLIVFAFYRNYVLELYSLHTRAFKTTLFGAIYSFGKLLFTKMFKKILKHSLLPERMV